MTLLSYAIIIVALLQSTILFAMNKPKTHERKSSAHFTYTQTQRSPKFKRVVVDAEFKTPSPTSDIETPRTPTNTPSHQIEGLPTPMSMYAVQNASHVIDTESSEEDKKVKKECTKFKLALLTGGTAIVSSAITAIVTYLNGQCK